MKHIFTFIKEFQDNFYLTGSLLPSSRFLGDALASQLAKHNGSKSVIEIGAGTGAVTERILKQLKPGDRLVMVEASDNFCQILRHNLETRWKKYLDGVEIELHSCLLQELNYEDEFDFAVSGLPLNNFPSQLVEDILKVYKKVLKSEGILSYFEYLGIRHFKNYFYRMFGKSEKVQISIILDKFIKQYQFGVDRVFLNFPPASARHFRFSSHQD